MVPPQVVLQAVDEASKQLHEAYLDMFNARLKAGAPRVVLHNEVGGKACRLCFFFTAAAEGLLKTAGLLQLTTRHGNMCPYK